MSRWQTSPSEASAGQVILELLVRSISPWNHLTNGSLILYCGYFPKCLIGMDIFSSWQTLHIGSLACGVSALLW